MWAGYMNANESFNNSLPFTGHVVWDSHLSAIPPPGISYINEQNQSERIGE